MSSEWCTLTIGDLVRNGEAIVQTGPFGSQLHSYDYVESGVPVIPTEAIGRGRILDVDVPKVTQEKAIELERHRLRIGDILFARRGAQATGLSALVDERFGDGLCGTGALLLRMTSKRVDPSFLAMYLSSEQSYSWLRTHAVGAVMPNINTDIIKALPICLPGINEQRSLASFFGAIDDRIRLLRETNATLEAIAQAQFKSWFVDFDPVRAKMAGCAPEGMDEATAALFPDALEETELGLVPKGWALRPFIDAVDVIGGGTPKTSNPDYWGGGIPWFSVVDAPDGADTFVIDTEKHITDAGLEGSSTKLLPQGTTIISARGTVGKLALTGCPMAMNQSCYGLRGKAGDSYFTYFSTCRLVEALKARSHGSVFDTITRDTLAGVHSLLPANSDVISAFEDAVSPLMSRVLLNLHQSSGLAELRDTLLPRLISGQLRLPEAQAQLEPHLS